jgi:hypothetical protein
MTARLKTPFVIAIICMFLTGCSSVPLGSIPKLSRVDFLTTDLDRLRVALILPSEIKPGENGVVLAVNYEVEGRRNDSNIILQESSDNADRVGLPANSRRKEKTYAYKFAKSEAKRFDQIRQQIQSDKAQNKNGTLDIAIQTKQFCSFGTPGTGPVYITIYVASVETDGYVLAARDLDLRQDKTTADLLNRLRPCVN